MSGLVTCSSGAVRWQVAADVWGGKDTGRACPLFGSEGIRLQEWLATGAARVVKQGLHRTVYHVVLPGLDFHLKHYPLTDTRSRLRQLLRPSKARTEYRRALAVAARGVPTLEPLAFGECGAAIQSSYLITRTVPGVCPVDSFLEQTLPRLPARRQTALRQALAKELGLFIARMHHQGITHDDLHPGNLLLRLDENDTPRLYLIDLHAVRVGRSLSWAAARDNLVLFNRWFILRAGRSERLRFFQAYAQARGEWRVASGEWPGKNQDLLASRPLDAGRDVEQQTVASNLAFWQHHDPRCVSSNRYFRRLRSGNVRGHAVADLDAGFVAALLARPDEPFRRPGAVFLKNSRSSTVIEIDVPGPGGPRTLIYKRFNHTCWSDPWTAVVRGTPALRSYRMGHALRWRGLPTPRPLLILHRHPFGLPREGYLLTEKLPEAQHVLDYVNALARKPAGAARHQLRALVQQLAQLIADLHERRIIHRDLKAANLLVSPEPWRVSHPDRPCAAAIVLPAASAALVPRLWLIDLVGVRLVGQPTFRQCVKNVTRIHASFHAHPGITRSDKLRFLRGYLRWGLRGKMGWKDWWRAIERATQTKVGRNLRRGRPLV